LTLTPDQPNVSLFTPELTPHRRPLLSEIEASSQQAQLLRRPFFQFRYLMIFYPTLMHTICACVKEKSGSYDVSIYQ